MIRVNGKSNLGVLAGMVDVREPRLFKIFCYAKVTRRRLFTVMM